MAEQPQMKASAGKIARPPAYRAAADVLTFKEILIMLRQHILLIILLTIAGLIVGGLSWFLFWWCFPSYTATAYIEVLSPIQADPTKIGQYTINRENQFVFRGSLASLIIQQGT